MIIELAPDYDLFVKILFVAWVVSGVLYILGGLMQVERSDRCGIAEVIFGMVMLLSTLWVITSG